jgi:hypothetical protein
MRHGPHCIPPDEVGATGMCVCNGESWPICEGCGCDIDPEYCWCGDAIKGHSWSTGHGPIPMGCVCGYSSQGE